MTTKSVTIIGDKPNITTMKVLVAGATGFVGKPLCEKLAESGYEVVAFSRSATKDFFDADVEVRQGELENIESVDGLFKDIDVAYYLIHSLTSENFAEKDRRYADKFQEEASKHNVDRVIYLSGISGNEQDLSPHLDSRREVEDVLRRGTFDLTVLRAAIIIGGKSASFRIIDDLTDRLPIMVVPKWVKTPSQPIYIEDVLKYLTGVLDKEETRGETYDIGGPDKTSYQELLQMTAEIKGNHLSIVSVPVMTPNLSAKWLRFTTDVQYSIAKPLVESMRYPVTVDEKMDLQNVIEIEKTPIREAISTTLNI